MLGQKKNQAAGNTVRNNLAHTFDFKADPSVRAENNRDITQDTFNERFSALAQLINSKFGDTHPTAKRPRFERLPARK